ncbi:hypothetical protein, partial [Pseudomonas amygdali]|uniref:hypothetical protein n=1 Tax=Pseudomonas amygdali TaxID=47877 RepID=UPI001F2C621C
LQRLPKGCNTLRVGTLYDFRTIENENLRDEGEGTFLYRVEFPALTKVSSDWLAAFKFQGQARIRIGHMEPSSSGVRIKDFTMEGAGHNCWIYCMSLSTDSAGDISKTHEDKWSIPEDKFTEFGNYLGALLWESIGVNDLPDEIVKNNSLQSIQKRLRLDIDVRIVEYKERALYIDKESDLPIQQIQALERTMAFIKPVDFAPEREVRIAFWLSFDNKLISISNNPKFLSLRPIDGLLRSEPPKA